MAHSGRFLSPKFVASEHLGSGFDADFLGLTSIGGGESRRGPYTGVKALMLAVLDNGITCYMSRIPRVRAEAEHWINSTRTRSPFCFPIQRESTKNRSPRRFRYCSGPGPMSSSRPRRRTMRSERRQTVRH